MDIERHVRGLLSTFVDFLTSQIHLARSKTLHSCWIMCVGKPKTHIIWFIGGSGKPDARMRAFHKLAPPTLRTSYGSSTSLNAGLENQTHASAP